MRASIIPTLGQIYRSILAKWAIVLCGMMMVIMTTVSFYLITVYRPTFGKSVLKLSATDSLLVTYSSPGLEVKALLF